MSKDYYNILGVDKNASQDEIKKAFRQKAHKYHPDKQGGDEAKFKEINQAYQVLSDQQKRQQYDQFGSNFDQAGAGGMNWQDFARAQGGGFNRAYGNVNMDDLGDIFGDFFGFGKKRKSKTSYAKGSDIEMQLEVDFKDAVFGAKKQFDLYKTVKCPKCSGNGAEPGTKINTCSTCNGTGRQTRIQQTILGAIQTQTTCSQCKGEGKIPEQKCSQCSGAGIIKENAKIDIEIPAGADNGEVIKVHNQGEAGYGGAQAGDLYIHLKVKPDLEFTRQGKDILSKKHISFTQAALGDKVDVKTVHGDVVLKIPPATQNNKVFRIKNKGIVDNYSSGDHYVEIIVDVPRKLSKRQKQLLQEFDKEDGKKGWF